MMPKPVTLKVCGVPGALSVMLTTPFLTPSAVAVNRTNTVHVPPAATATTTWHAIGVETTEKSPLAVTPVIVSDEVPVFCTVTSSTELGTPSGEEPRSNGPPRIVTAGCANAAELRTASALISATRASVFSIIFLLRETKLQLQFRQKLKSRPRASMSTNAIVVLLPA